MFSGFNKINHLAHGVSVTNYSRIENRNPLKNKQTIAFRGFGNRAAQFWNKKFRVTGKSRVCSALGAITHIIGQGAAALFVEKPAAWYIKQLEWSLRALGYRMMP